MKRLFDILISSAGLVGYLPFLVLVALVIKMTRSGMAFSRQSWLGRNFEKFDMFQFRQASRSPFDSDDGSEPKVERVLRLLKANEFLRLWNVLKGDMSLFGPRLPEEETANRFREDFQKILRIQPGIIDLISLVYEEPEKELKSKSDTKDYVFHILLPEKVKLWRRYAEKASFIYDCKLGLAVFFRRVYPFETIQKLIARMIPFRRPLVIGLQIGIFILCNYLAFFIRFEGDIPPLYTGLFVSYLPILLSFRVLFLFAFSLDQGLWRYASIRDLRNIFLATLFGSFLFFLALHNFQGNYSYPRSIFIIDALLNVTLLGGVRLLRRWHEKQFKKPPGKKRVIIIGAGNATEMFLRDLIRSRFYPCEVIGLIDDNPRKKGLKIRDIPVLGTRQELNSLIKKEKPDELIICIPSASRDKFEEIVKGLRQYGLPIKALPSFRSFLDGKGALSALRVINPEDILFRPPVQDSRNGAGELLARKRILITGAGGSIGSELSRQILALHPSQVILLERHEESLYKIDLELNATPASNSTRIVSVIGDILDENRMDQIMETYRPHLVFHAAAYKHVPLMESNPYEAFKTNVIGTKIMMEISRKFQADRFVLISTDKAVKPVNVMGMTKKIAEAVVQNHADPSSAAAPGATKPIIVRFGNVLGSSGSVVPLFSRQINEGGPVTVTHPEMERYFMTIPEAVNLVLEAAALGNQGGIFVLDMGHPIKILDLAKRMISLHGYRPGIDIEIRFTGLRPGEKLNEELFNEYEKIEKTEQPKIYRAVSNGSGNDRQNFMDELEKYPLGDIRKVLKTLMSKSGSLEGIL